MSADVILPEELWGPIAELGERYLWWDEPTGGHSTARMVAQIMNFGTYADILRLEELVTGAVLAQVMAQAEPGWFSPRSWAFWRGRLAVDLPEVPPSRSFADAG